VHQVRLESMHASQYTVGGTDIELHIELVVATLDICGFVCGNTVVGNLDICVLDCGNVVVGSLDRSAVAVLWGFAGGGAGGKSIILSPPACSLCSP